MELSNLLIYYVQLTLIIASAASKDYDKNQIIKESIKNDFEYIIDNNVHQSTKNDLSIDSNKYMTLGTAPPVPQNLKDFTTKSYMLMYDKHGKLAKTLQPNRLSKLGLNRVTTQYDRVRKYELPEITF